MAERGARSGTGAEVVRRLDRAAARLGVELMVVSPLGRAFWYGDRRLTYRPGGKGILRVISETADGELEAERCTVPAYLERLFVALNEGATR